MLEVGKVYLFVRKNGLKPVEAILKGISEDCYEVVWKFSDGSEYQESFIKELWKVYQEVIP